MRPPGQTGKQRHYVLDLSVHSSVRLFVCYQICEHDILKTNEGKGKCKGLDTCYSATYMSQTRDQQRFTTSEVAADWHEPMVPQRIMWPSIARANGQLDPRCS